MPLFEVAILEKPTKKEVEEEGAIEKLLTDPLLTVVATDEHSAALLAALKAGIPADVDKARLKVLVRPFG